MGLPIYKVSWTDIISYIFFRGYRSASLKKTQLLALSLWAAMGNVGSVRWETNRLGHNTERKVASKPKANLIKFQDIDATTKTRYQGNNCIIQIITTHPC